MTEGSRRYGGNEEKRSDAGEVDLKEGESVLFFFFCGHGSRLEMQDLTWIAQQGCSDSEVTVWGRAKVNQEEERESKVRKMQWQPLCCLSVVGTEHKMESDGWRQEEGCMVTYGNYRVSRLVGQDGQGRGNFQDCRFLSGIGNGTGFG